MRVITEERLKEWIKEVNSLALDDTFWIGEDISAYLEEIDTLTVSKLRPMSEAIGYTGGDILVYTEYYDNPGFERYIFDVLECAYIGLDGNELMLDEQQFIGWIPLPTYKPE